MTRLFGYGTFRHPAWRAAILGAEYSAEPATLRGYCRIAAPSGYLSLRETTFDAASVDGMLIELDAIGWRIADRWEEVPTSRRTTTARYRSTTIVTRSSATPRSKPRSRTSLRLCSDCAVPARRQTTVNSERA